MIGKLSVWAWGAAKLLLIEIFLPGGTLIVLGLLLARRVSPAVRGRLVGRSPAPVAPGSEG